MKVPVIDIFAGPGGLGEGFSSILENGQKVFDIKLSIEKDENAHKTLLLRSFFRQFAESDLPKEYYDVLREENLIKRDEKMNDLFDAHPKQYNFASSEAWRAELGSEKFPERLIDQRIQNGIGKTRDWVLIGGPPCQAYSLAGRSRVGGIDESDHRVYLYRQYLRIIAKFHPKVFVMENVKGLLSAKVGKESVFDWIKRDLNNPSKLFPEFDSPSYKVYSLSTVPETFDKNGNPVYSKDSDYLIKSEEFGIPQKRHRVILLGVRQDLEAKPSVLSKSEFPIELKSVIGDLPKIRSGLNRKFVRSYPAGGKKKRVYEKVKDDFETWSDVVTGYKDLILSWNGFKKTNRNQDIGFLNIGSEYIPCTTPSSKNPLYNWYRDPKLQGTCNHISRSHLTQDLMRYMFSSLYAAKYKRFPRLSEYTMHSSELIPDHKSAVTGKFADRFRVQLPNEPATTITSHISKDGHYFIHYDPLQCRSLTVREAARIQTFPDNYLFCGSRTAQYHQVGNAVPPYLAYQIAQIVKTLI
ncbi:DNA cytosine methyltransferase [Flagellimonas sediminis]|uniref:DNA (cytosine-5-)-methyltransferase n=1 Tax=Flagellimonas sediminis TaxID=2696468 RepID=A0A6I5KQP1_9FLAO|nr:DNA cytosine methyltransferase [Allomuricauda sediminis]NDV43086.1 DNA (cytosine-5-)-methyltransferase [Allomuricauda sediminis]